MIRPFTCVAMLLAAGSGLYLYQTKHRGQVLDRQISDVVRATEQTRARIGVLRAEFALLNDPTRLQELAATHLPRLAPTQPGQFTVMAELDARLPAPGARTAPPVVEPPAPALLVAAAPVQQPTPPALAPTSAPTSAPVAVPAPIKVATVLATPALASAPAIPATPSASAVVTPAAASPPMVTASVAPPVAKPPAQKRVKPTLVASAPVPRRPAPVVDPLITPAAAPAFVAPPRPAPVVIGSALGMARTMGSGASVLPAAAPGYPR